MVLCSTLRETQGDEFVQNLIRQPGDFKDNLKKVTNKLLFTYEPVTFDANADVYPFSWTMYEQYQTDIVTEWMRYSHSTPHERRGRVVTIGGSRNETGA